MSGCLLRIKFERMLVENEATFISALKADLNKPVQETIMAEIDFLRLCLKREEKTIVKFLL